MTYEEALPHRPPGACYCDLDDRECFEAGHWGRWLRLHLQEWLNMLYGDGSKSAVHAYGYGWRGRPPLRNGQ